MSWFLKRLRFGSARIRFRSLGRLKGRSEISREFAHTAQDANVLNRVTDRLTVVGDRFTSWPKDLKNLLLSLLASTRICRQRKVRICRFRHRPS